MLALVARSAFFAAAGSCAQSPASLDHFAHLAQLGHAFEQDNLHGVRSPYFTA
jgi:hypothetical protein